MKGLGILNIALISLVGCGLIGVEPDEIDILEGETDEFGTSSGDSMTGTADPSGDGDGDPSNGDGDGDGDAGASTTDTGDGDGDPTGTGGDGDGDPTGDGDGDPAPTGDGDGDGDPADVCTVYASAVMDCMAGSYDEALAECNAELAMAAEAGPGCVEAVNAVYVCVTQTVCGDDIDCTPVIDAATQACG